MLTTEDLSNVRRQAMELAEWDAEQLKRLRKEVQRLRGSVRSIRPRTTTTVSIVATDAGEDAVAFDPHLFYLVRLVDSQGRVLVQEVLTPWMDVGTLNRRHLENGHPKTSLGRLMCDLGVSSLWELSPMIPDPDTPLDSRNRRWLQDYRDLEEWASLYDYLTGTHEFATDTVVVRDGFLRSKIFADYLFPKMWDRIRKAVEERQRGYPQKVWKSEAVNPPA